MPHSLRLNAHVIALMGAENVDPRATAHGYFTRLPLDFSDKGIVMAGIMVRKREATYTGCRRHKKGKNFYTLKSGNWKRKSGSSLQ